jgi:hypothetical protein
MAFTEKPEITFYQKVGELFYAVAASDKIVRKAEYEALKQLVRTKWSELDHTTDNFNTEAIYQMEIVFDWFDYERMGADECFNNFENYVREHPEAFTAERKKLIMETANAIASSFSGKNKAELILLARLELLFSSQSSRIWQE